MYVGTSLVADPIEDRIASMLHESGAPVLTIGGIGLSMSERHGPGAQVAFLERLALACEELAESIREHHHLADEPIPFEMAGGVIGTERIETGF